MIFIIMLLIGIAAIEIAVYHDIYDKLNCLHDDINNIKKIVALNDSITNAAASKVGLTARDVLEYGKRRGKDYDGPM